MPRRETATPLARTSAVSSPATAPVARTEPPAPSSAEASTAPAVDPLRLALYHHRAGDFESALLAYRALLKQDELNASVHNNLGMLYQQKNLQDEAAREFQRALFIDPDYALARNNLGVTLLRQGKLDAAAAQFRALLERDARNTDALVNLALTQKGAGQVEQARSSLARALAISPRDAAAHYNLAVLFDEAGEAARAVEHYRGFLDNAGSEHAERAPHIRARIEALSKR